MEFYQELYPILFAVLDKMLRSNYLCLVEFKKQQIEEVRNKSQAENSETRATPISESGFVLCIAPPSLSRDRRIKIKKLLWAA